MESMLKGFFILPFVWIASWLSWLLWPFPQLVWKGGRWVWQRLRGNNGPKSALASSEFADDKKLKASGRLQPGGWLTSVTEKGKRVYTDPEASLLLVAQKGLGKTLLVIANILALKDRPMVREKVSVQGVEHVVERQLLPDLLVYDPKQGAYNATREELERMGYRVSLINIAQPDKSQARYNPLSILRPQDTYDIDRQITALTLLLCPDGESHFKNPHFDEYPRIMLAGIIKYMVRVKPSGLTMAECVNVLLSEKARENTFKLMEQMNDVLINGAVEVWNAVGAKERGSFISTNFRKLNIWLRPSVMRITSAMPDEAASINWTWETMFDDVEGPSAVFIIGGLGTGEGDLIRLIMGNLINSAKRRFNETGQPLRRPLQIIVDEPDTLGTCHAVMHINRELREAGVTLMMCWLSMADIKKHYSEWKTLVAGCDWLVYGDSKDTEWYDEVVKVLGKTVRFSEGSSESDTASSRSRHETLRNLMNQDELAEMPFEDCVAIMRSRKGMIKVRGRKPYHAWTDKDGVKRVEWL